MDPVLHTGEPWVPLTMIKLTERLEPWPLRTIFSSPPSTLAATNTPPYSLSRGRYAQGKVPVTVSQSSSQVRCPSIPIRPIPSHPSPLSLCYILRSARPPRRLSSAFPLLLHIYCDFWHFRTLEPRQISPEHCYWPGLTRLSDLTTLPPPPSALRPLAAVSAQVNSASAAPQPDQFPLSVRLVILHPRCLAFS